MRDKLDAFIHVSVLRVDCRWEFPLILGNGELNLSMALVFLSEVFLLTKLGWEERGMLCK